MPSFQCKKCKYKWSPRDDKKMVYTRCPYCAANGTVMTVSGGKDLVRDLDSMFE